ncbi:hypothetical protein [Priestia koreensis]|uniref:hypothetical protein n=1 Tax=Priestia koreensis TaxID=284581 RepID=UPI001F5A3FCB|nr:hypothetical protein [Priestia koreensis]MCM3005989.1 hypothetical protein [Priestia koreensis]UNL85329.1 hypothetical protein IE339_01955 [Priestia koreensis]
MKKMLLDIRANIGWILTIIGLLILVTGIVSPPTLKSLNGLNINLIWGSVTTIVGVIFLGLYFKNPDME